MSKLCPEERKVLNRCIEAGNCEEMVDRYWNLVGYCVRKAFSLYQAPYGESDIEDLRQEVFFRLFENDYRRLRQYNENRGMSLKSWVCMIASQTVGMYLRTKDRNGWLGFGAVIYAEELQTALDVRDREYANIDLIHKAVSQLPTVENLVIKYYYFDGLKLKDIAGLMRKKENAVYQAKHRALKRLKKIVENLAA